MTVLEYFPMWASNFAECVVEYDGHTYKTVEHAFQAQKPTFLAHKRMIQAAPSPGAAKRLARGCPMRPDWEQVKDQVMLDCLRSKFSRRPFRAWLLSTGDDTLVEWTSWHDRYWGVCKCGAEACNQGGLNKLGQLLEHVRAEILAGHELPMPEPRPMDTRGRVIERTATMHGGQSAADWWG